MTQPGDDVRRAVPGNFIVLFDAIAEVPPRLWNQRTVDVDLREVYAPPPGALCLIVAVAIDMNCRMFYVLVNDSIGWIDAGWVKDVVRW